MNYGYFDNDHREYVITTPLVPARWINYIGTLDFGGFVDNTGGGVICKGDAALNRITKYVVQLPASALNGETCYIRVKTKSGYELFTPFYTPALTMLDRYECRVGLSYSRFTAECKGLRVEVLVFVPEKHPRVLRRIRVTNISRTAIAADVIPVVEYSHFDAFRDYANADWVPQTMMSRLEQGPDGRRIVTQYAFMKKETGRNYFTSNAGFSSFETDRKKFLGNGGYGSWQHPLALDREELSNSEINRCENMCALMHHLGEVQPGETKEIITQLGQTNDLANEWQHIAHYADPAHVAEALAAQGRFWDGYLGTFQAETPDEAMNTMLNIHTPRQCFITFNWSRFLSLYELGLGLRGLGYRDSSQDTLGVLGSVPERARGLIEMLLQIQCRDGSAKHQFYPASMEANVGEGGSLAGRPRYYSDDHLWIVLAVAGYLKETGDLDFLEKEIPFYDKDPDRRPLEKATVLAHLERAVAFTAGDTGAHGLPLLGFADWNDSVNLPAGAESVFTACLYGRALLELIELLTFLGQTAAAAKLRRDHEAMKERVNKAWDGKWFVRYYNHEGRPLGSASSKGAKIYINSQTWAVLAGFADATRARTALDSVHEKLSCSLGYKLSGPSYNGYNPEIGGVTSYPPGAKENGGIFCHTIPWLMIAETMLGDGERAFRIYDTINPVRKNDVIETYEMEPYCYSQNMLGDEHPEYGKARNSWLSGTASWAYQAATRHILGIRPDYHGLVIDPCLPPSWPGFKVTRVWRGATYRIEVANPKKLSRGVAKLTVNGKEIAGNVAPFGKKGETIEVKVLLG
jgi:cellobiose phosphorylase